MDLSCETCTFVFSQNDKSTPLHLACTQGATEVVKLMLSSVDQVEDIINLTDGARQTPLHRWDSPLPTILRGIHWTVELHSTKAVFGLGVMCTNIKIYIYIHVHSYHIHSSTAIASKLYRTVFTNNWYKIKHHGILIVLTYCTQPLSPSITLSPWVGDRLTCYRPTEIINSKIQTITFFLWVVFCNNMSRLRT